MDTITAQFDLEIDNFKEEIFDYVISLFGINDRLVLDNELGFNLRIEELNILEKEVAQVLKEEFNESNKAIYHHAINKAKHKYLIKILRDFLGVSNYSFSLTNNDITSFTERNLGEIKNLKQRYSKCADLIFKRLLFGEAKTLNNDELKRFIEKGLSENEFAQMVDKAKKEANSLCKSAYDEETERINKIRLKKFTKITSSILATIIVIASVQFGTYYFFDIESLYKNQYFKSARISMEAVQYPSSLTDSTNPTTNEIRQKQRLDYIRDLNSRYFKVIDLFLNPTLSTETIKTSLKNISIPDTLKNINTIILVRNNLGIFTQSNWEVNFSPLTGPNVLTQLRAYGAIANFLMPPLSHYVLKDSRGLPIKNNGKLQVYSPPPEKEILNNHEPKDYLIKYDKTYKTIGRNMSELLEKVQKRKKELIKTYKGTNKREVRENTKNTLHAIALLESRLLDLNEKFKERHDYIIKHNTYRLPLE